MKRRATQIKCGFIKSQYINIGSLIPTMAEEPGVEKIIQQTVHIVLFIKTQHKNSIPYVEATKQWEKMYYSRNGTKAI